MQTFPDYIRQRLEANGYEFTKRFANLDLFMRSPDGQPIWICYLDVQIEPEQIRRMFDFDGHVLIVVNEKLIPDEIVSREETPLWLRVLHGLYLGRIYVWNDRHLFGLHFDYDSGDVSESGIIQPTELLLIETGTWLRGWSGIYRLARFKDQAWWTTSAGSASWDPRNDQARQKYDQADASQKAWRDYYQNTWTPPKEDQKTSSSRQAYEQARDHYWEQQRKREQSGRYGYEKYNTPPPKQDASGKRDFMREFMACTSKAEAKALFKKLAKEFHPDLSGRDTTADMQQINAAWDKAERMFK